MEVTVLEAKKSQFIFELDEINHTLCNMLKMELWNNKNVKAAGYRIKHPLVGKSTFFVEMKSGDAKKAVQEALATVQKQIKDLQKQAAKL